MPNVLQLEAELRHASGVTTPAQKARFRSCFQRVMRDSLRSGAPVEKAFGSAWELATEQVRLSDHGESELYEELIRWAKNRR